MQIEQQGETYNTDLKDLRGVAFQVGDMVARASMFGRSAEIEVVKVTRIEDGKMYVGGSKVAIKFPGRMLIVNEVYADQIKMEDCHFPEPAVN